MNQILGEFVEIEEKFVTNLTYNRFKEFNQKIEKAYEGKNVFFYEICLKNKKR